MRDQSTIVSYGGDGVEALRAPQHCYAKWQWQVQNADGRALGRSRAVARPKAITLEAQGAFSSVYRQLALS